MNEPQDKIDYSFLSDDTIVDKAFLGAIRPQTRLTVSEWSDSYRILSSKTSGEAGPWRTSRTPYLKEPMDKLSIHDPCTEIVVKKGAQIGFSEAGFNWLGYIIDHAPSPTMMVMPTVDTAKTNIKTRVEPMIEETPAVRNKIGDPEKKKDKDNTTMLKMFVGGMLKASGANSAASLRSLPIRNLMLDEEDAYPMNLDGEGSPIKLAIKRTSTFGSRRKIFRISTPTYEDTSTISVAYENSTKKVYQVPCPHCETMQEIKWEQIQWENNDPETVKFYCIECGVGIDEHHKTMMLREGEWAAEHPEREVEGYFINSLYSPLGWYSWKQAVKDFIDAKGNEEEMVVFHNTVLGRTWKNRGDAPDWKRLFLRRENYKIGVVPDEVSFLTMAVDVQKDRLEAEVVGWAKGKENWSITYEIIMGETAEHNTDAWLRLDALIQKQFEKRDGSDIPISLTVIDSGFNTQAVYNFCRKYPRSRVLPIKGSSTATTMVKIPRAVDVRATGRTHRMGMKVWTVGVNVIKKEIYGILKQDQPLDGESTPPGWYHFPEYDEEYFKMLTAEQLVKKKNNRGFYVYEWQKIRNRNEALDLKVYNRAASNILGIDRMRDSDFDAVQKKTNIVKPKKIRQDKSKVNQGSKKTKRRKKKKKRDSSLW